MNSEWEYENEDLMNPEWGYKNEDLMNPEWEYENDDWWIQNGNIRMIIDEFRMRIDSKQIFLPVLHVRCCFVCLFGFMAYKPL